MPPNREPMWYCHECGSEMRPLMVPDPHCASCNGTFVEMVESPQDDPRVWRNLGAGDDGDLDDLAAQLRDVFPRSRPSGGGFTFSINRGSSPGGNTRTIIFGAPGQTDIAPDRVMPMTEFLAESAGNGGRPVRDGLGPLQPVTFNQLLWMLAQRHADQRGPGAPNPLADMLGMHRGGPEGGRLGDYALNQEALDQIMTALMENSNAHRPVAATEEVIKKLNHEVLEEGSPLLEKDCAVCKDQFSLQTEDPDEQVVITLPCKHPFHSSCILPWLKQNGTCPTCRHQLVPQPGSAQNPNDSPGSGPRPSSSTPDPLQPTNPFAYPRTGSSSFWSASSRDRDRGELPERGDGSGGGLFGVVGNIWNSFAGGNPNSGPEPSSSGSGPDSLPGSWEPNPSPRPESGVRSSQIRSQPNQYHSRSYSNSGQTRPQPTPSPDQPGFVYGSSHGASSNDGNRHGWYTPGRSSYNPGSHRRSSRDQEGERQRDRNGQRRNTYRRDHPESDQARN